MLMTRKAKVEEWEIWREARTIWQVCVANDAIEVEAEVGQRGAAMPPLHKDAGKGQRRGRQDAAKKSETRIQPGGEDTARLSTDVRAQPECSSARAHLGGEPGGMREAGADVGEVLARGLVLLCRRHLRHRAV